MRRNLILALSLVALLTVGFATVAFAKSKWTVFKGGTITMKVDGGTTPKALPKKKMAPVKVRVRGQIADSGRPDGHPSNVRILDVDFDKNGTLDTTGLPVCRSGQLQTTTTATAMKNCGKTLVGEGKGDVQVKIPEKVPFPVSAPIKAFNGGTKGNTTTLLIHSYTPVPVPVVIVTDVKIKKVKKGRYGLSTVSKVPSIAGGWGSVVSFDILFGKFFNYKGKKRTYIKAKCTDGKFHARVNKLEFRDEATALETESAPSPTVLNKGTVIRPCTPKG